MERLIENVPPAEINNDYSRNKPCDTQQCYDRPEFSVPHYDGCCRRIADEPFDPYLRAQPTLPDEEKEDSCIEKAVGIPHGRYYLHIQTDSIRMGFSQ